LARLADRFVEVMGDRLPAHTYSQQCGKVFV
jgi:hypothetical protein